MPVENNTSTQSAFSYLQYKNKVSGLVSGMDIDSIMEKLMKAESAQMEKLQQQKQKYEWKRDAYRDVNTKLSTFEKNAFTDYGLKSSWNMKNVSASNESASAVATSSANGTLNITEGKLATAAQSVVDMSSSNITADSTIASLGMTSGEFTMKAINDKGEYTEKTIKYNATDKVSDVMSKINSSGVGVTALVADGKLSLTANTEGTGAEGSINITADDGGLFQKLGVLSDQTGKVAEGSNGYVVANGVKIEGTSNKYNISGYQVTLNKNITTNDAATKITSTNDTDKVVDKVKKFVDSYNELIADLGKQTSERKKTGYAPLTDAQKSEMTKDEIEKWEVAAKQGLLKGDSTINKVLSDLRSTLSTYGSGSEDMLAKIGITTSKSYKDNGKLEIDEDKLRKALESDPDVVSRIFTGDGNGNDGIVSKMRTTAQNAVKTIQKTAGSATSESDATYSLGKTITSLDNKIDDWKDRLKGIEERYWKQFSAMENAIQKANSQSSIFMQY